ncbi:MAG: hypothetical protein AAF151_26630, partial [Cyanobacteria bacterium J06656_5]
DSAQIAEISERSGQRIESGEIQPNRGRQRDWCKITLTSAPDSQSTSAPDSQSTSAPNSRPLRQVIHT